MQGNSLFEYAVLRLSPRVEREEFLNIGVILYCQPQNFLACRFAVSKEKILSLYEKADLEEIKDRLEGFTRICKGEKDSGEIGALPIASRFRWLTANRSTILQTSRIHPGFCTNPQETLDKLFEQLVL